MPHGQEESPAYLAEFSLSTWAIEGHRGSEPSLPPIPVPTGPFEWASLYCSPHCFVPSPTIQWLGIVQDICVLCM